MGHQQRAGFSQVPLTWSLLLLVPFAICLLPTLVKAQIVPDTTLPVNSTVTRDGDTLRIDRGTTAGSNLFHSFEQFSVPTGASAFFNNNPAIQNIFTRVTGGSVSNIDGIIQTNGTANLFLLNPNGIIFGPNAQLSIGGSFLASTANSINFADGSFFSAKNPSAPPLLSVNVPIGLQYGSSSGEILVQGSILQVLEGQTLALVGGNVALEGAQLLAPQGRIEVTSVVNGSLSLVNDNGQLTLSNDQLITEFGDIQLSQESLVDTSSDNGGGDIQFIGRRVTLADGSLVQSTTLGVQRAGSIIVSASESLELRGNTTAGFPSGLLAETAGSGNSGDITINTGRLSFQNGAQASTSALEESTGQGGNIAVNASSIELIGESGAIADTNGELFFLASGFASNAQGFGDGGNITLSAGRLIVRDGAQVAAATFGEGRGGNVFVNASELVELIGTSKAGSEVPSGLFSTTDLSGNGGEVRVDTKQLIVRDGAQIGTTTFGEGKAGDIFIRASESVEVRGRGDVLNSGLFAAVDRNATGDGGTLTVETRQLVVENQAEVSTTTDGQGQGGILIIDAERLIIQNGGQVSALTTSDRPGGTLTVNASELVEVSGTSTAINPITGLPIPSGLFTQTQGAGNAGDLKISTRRLSIRDRAKVSVSGEATGNAGSLEIDAEDVRLNNQAILTGATVSGQGGNIRLQSEDIQLRNQSQISTTAGTADRPGDGGNITIRTETIVGLENSDISANAFNGTGGVVDITTQGIFGLEARSRAELENLLGTSDLSQFDPNDLPDNDITAISRTEPTLSGIVEIQTPDVDPTRGLVELQAEPVDVSRLIDQNPCTIGTESELVQTGRGGLPATPNDAFSGDAVWEDWRATSVRGEQGQRGKETGESTPNRIVEATSWQINANGELVLIASASAVPSRSIWMTPAGCSSVQTKSLPYRQVKAPQKTFQVKGFAIAGTTVFKAEQFNKILSHFAQIPLTFDQLLEARNAITQLYVSNGYITSGAFIPPQISQNGVVVIQVIEGQLEDIKVNTKGQLNPNYVRSRLSRTLDSPLKRETLLKALQLLQLDPQIETLSAELSQGVRAGTSLLTVRVEEIPSFGTQLAFDNNRSPSVGSFRQSLQTSYANVLGLGDVASVAYANTEGSGDWDIGYIIPINPRNGTLSFGYSTASSNVIEPPFDEVDIEAKSRTYDLTYRQPLLQTILEKSSQEESEQKEYVFQEFALGLTASRRESQTSLLGVNYPLSPGANDDGETRISAVRFFQEWTQRDAREVLAARSEFSLGLGMFDATVNSNEPDSQFLAWRGQGQWVRRIAEDADTLLLVRGDVQLSAGELLGLEQFSLGGQNSVRGYRQDALLTDNGALASIELRVPVLRLSRQRALVQIAPFVDVGVAWNSNDRASLSSNILASTGIGLRLRLGSRLRANLDWGIPLINIDSRERTWQENGLYFSITSTPF